MSLKIMIVDDSSTMRAIIKRTLDMAQLPIDEFFEAASGKEALDLLAKQSVDLVLADINMPEMSGTEMTEHMQKDEQLKSIPVIVISTEASTTRIEDMKKNLGVKGFVHKPFTPEQIRDVINEVTGACHAANN